MKKERQVSKEKIIEKLAAMIPDDHYLVKTTNVITGEDAKLTGLKPAEGTTLEDDQDYCYECLGSNQVNHKRRMMRAYKRAGKTGLKNYMLPYIKTSRRNEFLNTIKLLPL